jgi:hypothetical protein
MSIATNNAAVWEGCSYLEYIQDTTCISRSMLVTYRKSPRLYEARYIARTVAPTSPTEAMQIGSAVHAIILEPHRVTGLSRGIPAGVLNKDGERRGKAWTEFKEQFGSDFVLMTQSDFDRIRRMVDSVWANRHARSLLEQPDRYPEHTIKWNDPATALKCKCRFDGWAEIPFDIKTAQSAAPQDFAKSAATYGYHNQEAFYKAGAWSLTGEAKDFPFIVVSKEPPHEVAVYQLDDDDVALGHKQNMQALEEISERLAENRWHAPYEQTITTIELPKWAHHLDDWRIA